MVKERGEDQWYDCDVADNMDYEDVYGRKDAEDDKD
jgi:hypothetical protein